MTDNTTYVIAIVAISLLGFLFVKLRTSYIRSLFEKINEQEVMIGQTINQLASVKAMNSKLEETSRGQLEQITNMSKVNSSHTEKLTDSYQSSKQLIEDLKAIKVVKRQLEEQVAMLDIKHEHILKAKEDEMDKIESSYKKVTNSFEIMQKSNDNLREQRDFYRNEFTKLRDLKEQESGLSIEDNIKMLA